MKRTVYGAPSSGKKRAVRSTKQARLPHLVLPFKSSIFEGLTQLLDAILYRHQDNFIVQPFDSEIGETMLLNLPFPK
jgi:hypothetical protein